MRHAPRLFNLTALGLLVPMASLSSECDEPSEGKPAELAHPDLFYGDNPSRVPIPADAEIDPQSDLYVARMKELQQSGGFLMTLNGYASPVYFADATTPRFTVMLNLYGSTGSYCGFKALTNVPIPSWADADPESDGQMSIVDDSTGCVYEFWGYNNSLVAQPNAWWASALPVDGSGIYQDVLSAGNAGNFSRLNGAVWPDEVAAGYIDRALEFAMEVSAVRGGGPVPPARHSDGDSTEPDAIPEGTRVQLDPDLDLSTLGLSQLEMVVARALQEYGMFLVDRSGGGLRLGGISPLSTSTNPWEGLVEDPDAPNVSLNKIPVEHFRVLRIPDPQPDIDLCNSDLCSVYQ